jgi:hypothetical protein
MVNELMYVPYTLESRSYLIMLQIKLPSENSLGNSMVLLNMRGKGRLVKCLKSTCKSSHYFLKSQHTPSVTLSY